MTDLNNLLLLAAELLLYFSVMATLFRLRHRFGIGIFFCALGTMHFLETYLAAILYIHLPFGIVTSPGSSVLFAGKLVMLLLLYIREDAASVRQPIYGLLIGNFLMVGLVVLLRHHDLVPAVPERLPDFRFMDEMGWLMIWGTTLLFIDGILIILIYERSALWLGDRQTLRILVSAAIVLSFDQFGFYTALHLFLGVPVSVLYGGWAAKMTASVAYALLAGGYLRWIERAVPGHVPRPNLSDVFDTLTYRQRYEALLQQTGRDALTGLFDRGRFDRDGEKAVLGAGAAGRPISLLIIDIDHFKLFNDRHGHAIGDEVLRRMAKEITAATREGDRVYRYGGEEFIVLCDGLAHSSALVAAERLRRHIAAAAVPGLESRITASIGIASGPEDGDDLANLFACADARLYAAKDAGRDRVVGRTGVSPEPDRDRPAETRRPA
jgi:diguanylate cyclase (GGDEF)-like protein